MKFLSTANDRIRWHMPESLRAVLLDGRGLRLAEFRDAGTLTTIKDSPHRAVYRVCLPGLDLHIKHNKLLGWRSRVREALRSCKARREFELAQTLLDRGIATPEPLAWGRDGLESWLITRTAPGIPLLTLPRRDHRLAAALGNFVARLHDARILHQDLHPGNILVDWPGESPSFTLLDLHAVRLRTTCTWDERRANLAVFNRFFVLRASRSERLRFWSVYRRRAGQAIPLPADRSGREIERLTRASNAEFWLARDRRCLASNRYYRRFRTGAMRGYAVRELSADALIRDPDAILDGSAENRIKDSPSSTVAAVTVQVDGRDVPAILKRFRVVDPCDPLLGLLRTTPAVRSWVAGHGFRERLLPTARPLAVWHRIRSGLPCEGYLLTEKIENAIELRRAVDELALRPSAERRAEFAVRLPALARLIRQMHERGLAHRDLKAANILASTLPGDPRYWFIDLVGIRRRRTASGRRRVQNLARLNASFLDHPIITRGMRLRFLRSYMQWGLRGKSRWKTWWQRIAAATRAKQAKNLKSGRVLA